MQYYKKKSQTFILNMAHEPFEAVLINIIYCDYREKLASAPDFNDIWQQYFSYMNAHTVWDSMVINCTDDSEIKSIIHGLYIHFDAGWDRITSSIPKTTANIMN